MRIWLRVNIVKTLTTQKMINKMDKKKLQIISKELKKSSAMHKSQANRIDKLLKSMKPTKKTKRG